MNASLAPRRIAPLAVAFLLIALTVLLARPSFSSASAKSTCSASAAASAKQHVRACAGRNDSARAHAKVKGHHAKHNHSTKKSKAKRKSAHSPGPALRPATCADGTTPKRAGGGEYTCVNGADPICATGAEPVAKRSGARLLCPAKPSSEFSEANCEDGSSPERSEDTGVYACEDGSRADL